MAEAKRTSKRQGATVVVVWEGRKGLEEYHGLAGGDELIHLLPGVPTEISRAQADYLKADGFGALLRPGPPTSAASAAPPPPDEEPPVADVEEA